MKTINIVWIVFGIVVSSFYGWLFYMWLSLQISYGRYHKKLQRLKVKNHE